MDYSSASIQSDREYMEDELSILITEDYSIFGIYDGHGGKAASKFCKKYLLNYIAKGLKEKLNSKKNLKKNIQNHIKNSFKNIDNDFRTSKNHFICGTTAVVVIITKDLIIMINCGDSRATLSDKNGEIIISTKDHKPCLPQEKKRIENAGKRVKENRVDGVLALSRAIGDFDLKNIEHLTQEEQPVICTPDITFLERKHMDCKYLILGSDGIWDSINDKKLNKLAHTYYTNKKLNLKDITNKLINDCESSDKRCDDNKTIIFIVLYDEEF